MASRALKLCPGQFVGFHITIIQSISKVWTLWWNRLCFNSCFPTNYSLLSQRRMSLTEKQFSTSRCNFRRVVMCHQSELLNYSSVTVMMMTLLSWCIQIMGEFSFYSLFLVYVRQSKILDEPATDTRRCVFTFYLPTQLIKDPYSYSQTHITTSVCHNLPLCSLQEQMHCTVKDIAVNYLSCLCCARWDEATSNE